MVQKKILILFLLLFCSSVFAATLSQVTVRSTIPLNENLTISGHYLDPDKNAGVLCSFRIFDTQTTDKYLIKRLSDEYTFSDGSFSTEYQITEPLFQRGYDYNAVVCCNIACYDQNFYVGQKDEIAFGKTTDSLILDVAYWNDGSKLIIVFFTAIVLGMIYLLVFRR